MQGFTGHKESETHVRPLHSLKRRATSPRLQPRNLLRSLRALVDAGTIFAFWSQSRETARNFGDALNPILIALLSGKRAINSRHVANIAGRPVYSVIGSILEKIDSHRTIVWGSGFMHDLRRPGVAPEAVLAVRGPLSRSNLVRAGIDCPEIYGDPALLCPLFFPANKLKTHELGIVPHYMDKNSPHLKRLSRDPAIFLIDVEADPEKVIQQINQCERIASSSLHGLIVADAYGIPSVWLRLSASVAGKGFKFRDYFASVGREEVQPIDVSEQTTIDDILSRFLPYEIEIDTDMLLEVCPFYDRNHHPMIQPTSPS